MTEAIALTGIVVIGLVLGIVAIVAIFFGVGMRSKTTSEGIEVEIDAPKVEAKKPRLKPKA